MIISSYKYGDFKGLVENKVKIYYTDYVPPDVFLKYTNLCLSKLHTISGIKDYEDYLTLTPINLVNKQFTITFLRNIDRIKKVISDTLGEFHFFDPDKYDACNPDPHFDNELFFTRISDKLIFHNKISDAFGSLILHYYRLPLPVTLDTDYIDFKDDNIDTLVDFVSYKILLDQKGNVPQTLYNSVNELLKEKDATIEEKSNKVKKEISNL